MPDNVQCWRLNLEFSTYEAGCPACIIVPFCVSVKKSQSCHLQTARLDSSHTVSASPGLENEAKNEFNLCCQIQELWGLEQ